jgi:hypothetical protein
VKGNELVLEVNGRKQLQLVPDRNDRFNMKGASGYSVAFVTDPAGKVSELKLVQPDGVCVAKRAESSEPPGAGGRFDVGALLLAECPEEDPCTAATVFLGSTRRRIDDDD